MVQNKKYAETSYNYPQFEKQKLASKGNYLMLEIDPYLEMNLCAHCRLKKTLIILNDSV